MKGDIILENPYRNTLAANTEVIVPHGSQHVTVLNLGPGDVFVNFGKTATTSSLLVPAGMGRSFYLGYVVKNVHVISSDVADVQIDKLG